jgi:heme-degrading monooxygenase HmoA
MSDVIELSRFRVAEQNEQAFLASYPALVAAMKGFDGLKAVQLGKGDDGTYVFVAVWAGREDCERAMEAATSQPAIATFLSHIEEDLSMEFAEIVEPTRAAA